MGDACTLASHSTTLVGRVKFEQHRIVALCDAISSSHVVHHPDCSVTIDHGDANVAQPAR